MRRDISAWRKSLQHADLSPATINNHIASLSGFTTWVCSQAPHAFPTGNPTTGIGELGLPEPEPRALSDEQVRSLKNICDRLPQFSKLKGRQHHLEANRPIHSKSRPWRDRAIIFVLLSTGLRREELTRLNIEQVEPNTIEELRHVRRAQMRHVQGKGNTERSVFLSADARVALADYFEHERSRDVSSATTALFLSAIEVSARAPDGRLSPRAINLILEQIGRWHDAELNDPQRHLSPLRPHDLRHTFAFQLSRATGADAYELERRLGHRSQRYIQRYTHPPQDVAAKYVEDF